MKPEEQRIAIAETCGYHHVRTINGFMFGVPKNVSDDYGNDMLVPPYLTDLNAMHEAEKVLTYEQRDLYMNELFILTNIGRNHSWGNAVLATPDLRAEAFLRTIGKWQDGE